MFIEDVIHPHAERVKALEEFEKASRAYKQAMFFLQLENEISKEEVATLEEESIQCRQHLEQLLDEDERERLSLNYFCDDGGYEDFDKIDVQQCRLWITKRAYELGWDSELFPEEMDMVPRNLDMIMISNGLGKSTNVSR